MNEYYSTWTAQAQPRNVMSARTFRDRAAAACSIAINNAAARLRAAAIHAAVNVLAAAAGAHAGAKHQGFERGRALTG